MEYLHPFELALIAIGTHDFPLDPTSYTSDILKLRLAVAYLGEKSQAGWWKCEFLHPVGFQYLKIIYPKSFASAALLAATEAACRIHDERIGRGHVAHLFRMHRECESALNSAIRALSLEDLAEQCSSDRAYVILEEIAAGAAPLFGKGPIQVGSADAASSPKAVSCAAATYLAGFKAGTAVFPYFA